MYGLTVITGPTQEPVTLAEARSQARVDHVTDDATLAGYIIAARQWVETVTSRLLTVQTLELSLDCFPYSGILLPRGPVTSIVSISYLDSEGVEQTVPSTDYLIDVARPVALVVPAYGKSWPASRGTVGNVKVRFVAGEAQPPQPLRHALLLLVSHWNENRESPADNPAVDALIAPYRAHFL